MIRNKRHHFNELPDSVKPKLEPLPHGFLSYFTAPSRFPTLLISVYNTVIASPFLRSHSLMAPYLPTSLSQMLSTIGTTTLGSAFPIRSTDASASTNSENGENTGNHKCTQLLPHKELKQNNTVMDAALSVPSSNRQWMPLKSEWLRSLSDNAIANAKVPSKICTVRMADIPSLDPNTKFQNLVLQLEQRIPDFALRQRAIKGGSRYKCKLCVDFEKSGGHQCPRGDDCGYAHGRHELRKNPSSVSINKSINHGLILLKDRNLYFICESRTFRIILKHFRVIAKLLKIGNFH